ncbi:helix-turn-helix domain-containing protein [Streptomyces sp. NBC_01803]|uniref:helix-turn-helix domain-containing protein n=1 Tax=Streptomyces sp. NBC_01803 TaxID=2975946 RepID=UPI002DDA2AD8|nr:helix-turn-helix transcriptional regulator [Streptomyces sp. NBC_01803]WSA43229.1 helix-turn-helix domain-containing protein [Streptomyces sp. NBC_01803]
MAVVSSSSPLTARRKLGAELRLLRDGTGLTAEEVGGHLGCHGSKVSRVELGKRTCTRKDFDALMELYEVDDTKREVLAELFKRGRQRVPPWWHIYNDVISANYSEFLSYEAEAAEGREYQPLLIPGLLQSADYARAVTGSSYVALGPDQVDSLVEVRLRRQERLREKDPLVFDGIVTEAALRIEVGGAAVMRAQLRKLVEVMSLPNVNLRVIPFKAGEKGASTGAFILFSSATDAAPDVAFTESAENTTSLRDEPIALRRLNRMFNNLSAAALSTEDSVELLRRIEKELV